jgi:hypothetical protein
MWQVHKGKLREGVEGARGNRIVAVKVQYPGALEVMVQVKPYAGTPRYPATGLLAGHRPTWVCPLDPQCFDEEFGQSSGVLEGASREGTAYTCFVG